MAWHNNDGLYIKFGTEQGVAARGGESTTDGNSRVVTFEVNMEDVTAVSAPLYLSDTLLIPSGAIVTEVKITVLEATVGTNSNLDLGFAKQDRTEYDYNGLLTAADGWHTAAQGTVEVTNQGGTDEGALLGIVLANDSYVTANYDTAAFTDGVLQIQLTYVVPVYAS